MMIRMPPSKIPPLSTMYSHSVTKICAKMHSRQTLAMLFILEYALILLLC